MKHETVTYDLFSQTVEKMRGRGEKISVRTVQAQTGGSSNKISEFLKKWRAQKEYAESVLEKGISQHPQEAILSEIGKAVSDTRSSLEKKLSESDEDLMEAKELISKQEAELEEIREEAAQLKSSLSTQIALKESMQPRF